MLTTTASSPYALPPELSDHEFDCYSRWLHDVAGMHMTAAKKSLVSCRLGSRLRELGMDFGEYYVLIANDDSERQHAVDRLTTNETYFFREEAHFDFLAQAVRQAPLNQPFRVWSAASSTGEEAYSAAMVLDEQRGIGDWEVVGSDISRRVLQIARRGRYAAAQLARIPQRFHRPYVLNGTGAMAGQIMVEPTLRRQVSFTHANLKHDLSEFGEFDLIFLRNVMIYFDRDMRINTVEKMVERLHPGGYLIIGHAESLNGISRVLRYVQPGVYQKPGGGLPAVR